MPGASWRSKETWSHYRKRFRGALHTWAKAMYGDQAVLTNLLRYGFTACCPDTPAKALGTAMHMYNDHAKQNREDKRENRKRNSRNIPRERSGVHCVSGTFPKEP